MNNSLFQIWKDANQPVDYAVAAWVTLLFGIASVGFGKVIFELITNPEQFKSITFGIFDYI